MIAVMKIVIIFNTTSFFLKFKKIIIKSKGRRI